MTEPTAPTTTESTEYTPGGDMVQGTASAHIETIDEIEANPIDPEPVAPVVESYKTQHAKVLRFEVSIGKNDDDRTLEQFEADIRAVLQTDPGPQGLPPHNITFTGGYYIIDGKVCLARDYDPATKNRRPGTFPPSWAGGPVESSKTPTGKPSAVVEYDTPETVATKAKGAKVLANALTEALSQVEAAKNESAK